MHFMTSLIIVFGFAFAVCFGVVKMIWDLSQASVHASPAIREMPGRPASAEGPRGKATKPYESSPTELSDTP
jgi:hypothetical protein